MSEGIFSYDDNAGMEKITEFGVEWYFKLDYNASRNGPIPVFHFTSHKFGEFYISKNALNRIKKEDSYKVLSLLYEQKLNKNNYIYSITLPDEKDYVQWKYDNFISLNLEDFLDRFPSDFNEIQNRSLINMCYLFPDYGQKIANFDNLMCFAKNNPEMHFFLKSLEKMGLIETDIVESDGRIMTRSIIITAVGWVEIDNIKKKNKERQFFISMLFNGIDCEIEKVKELGVRKLLKESITFFKQNDPIASKNAVEKLWDAFERIKTFYINLDKKKSLEKIIKDVSNGKEEFIAVFDNEFNTLTKIGNDFRIRHHETNKIDITDDRHYNYFFNRCMSLILLINQYLE